MSIGVCSFRVRGGGIWSYFSERVPCRFVSLSALRCLEGYHGRTGQIISCHRCLTYPRVFLGAPSQLSLSRVPHHSGPLERYNVGRTPCLSTPCFRGDIYIGHSSGNETHPIRYLPADNSFKPRVPTLCHTRKLVHQHRLDSCSRNERLTRDWGRSPSAETIVIAALTRSYRGYRGVICSCTTVTSYTFTYVSDHPKQPPPPEPRSAATVSNVILGPPNRFGGPSRFEV